MWYRIELKRKGLALGRYHGYDAELALHYVHKWNDIVKKHEAHQFQVSIQTNDKHFSDRLNVLV